MRFLLALLMLSAAAQAQTGVTVAGSGYRSPANVITAAPGQVMIISVYGLSTRIPDPISPLPVNGALPTQVAGISIDFVQGPLTVQLQIRYVQQSAATSFTIQIPYELNPESSARPVLRIKENGATAAEIAINAVTDNVHVINSCDQTGIFLSLAADLPAGTCTPMAMHARGPLVSRTAPAKPGETLVLWAYGLGAIDHPVPEFCCAFPEQLPLAVQPFFTSFSFADPGRFPLRRLPPAIPSYAGMTGSGLYQVHFVVPDVPASLSPCTGGMGNVSVQVNGPNSSDTAQICVQP